MKNLSIENIIVAVHGTFHGDHSLLTKEISAVTIDSRNVTKDCLFAAIRGEKVDGHDYIASSIQGGALCVIAEKIPQECEDLPVIIVKNTVEALGNLANFYRCQFGIPVIGISGSVGKTTTKEMIASVLGEKYNVLKTFKNLNNELGVPLTLFELNESHQVAVIEMGISHFGEMTRLSQIVMPDYAVLTNIGEAHLEFLDSLKGVFQAKMEILSHLSPSGTLFACGDDEFLQTIKCQHKLCLYGTNDKCSVKALDTELCGIDSMNVTVESGSRSLDLHLCAYGAHLVYAALAGASIAMELGLSDEEIKRGVEKYQPVGGRSNIFKTDKLTIIDDCYNSNPTSLKSALSSLALLPQRRVCIMGDMGELGLRAEYLHGDCGATAAEMGIDTFIGCGKLTENACTGAVLAGCRDVHYFKNKSELYPALKKLIHEGDTILVKASHAQGFETIVEKLKELTF